MLNSSHGQFPTISRIGAKFLSTEWLTENVKLLLGRLTSRRPYILLLPLLAIRSLIAQTEERSSIKSISEVGSQACHKIFTHIFRLFLP